MTQDFNLFLSPTQFLQFSMQRERCDRATDWCHLETDVIRLIQQLFPNAGFTEVLHVGPARIAQLQARGEQLHIVPDEAWRARKECCT